MFIHGRNVKIGCYIEVGEQKVNVEIPIKQMRLTTSVNSILEIEITGFVTSDNSKFLAREVFHLVD